LVPEELWFQKNLGSRRTLVPKESQVPAIVENDEISIKLCHEKDNMEPKMKSTLMLF